MSNGIDYPTNGAWGETDGQWKTRQTEYEQLLDKQQEISERMETLETRKKACIVLQLSNRDYALAFSGLLSVGEITALDRQWAYLEARRVLCHEQYNNSSNDLRKLKTKIHNHR
jgi:hypothetical protein